MIDDLIESIEDTYGKYKHGMRKAITEKLSRIDEQTEKKLYDHITTNYDLARPPSLTYIMGALYKTGTSLLTQGYGGMSVCEFCNHEYDQALVACPKCNEIRKYGVAKLYKMGEGKMHPFEISERKKAIEAVEPSAEEIRKFNEYLANTNGLKGLLWGKIKNLRKENKS